MLRLQTVNTQIPELLMLFDKHNINATVTKNSIEFEENISSELYAEICQNAEILKVEKINNIQQSLTMHSNPQNNIRSKEHFGIRSGDIYLCDLGEITNHEQAGKRPVIVLETVYYNTVSHTFVGIPLTTQIKKGNLPHNVTITYTDDVLIDRVDNFNFEVQSVALLDQIRVLDNERIIRYVGKLSPEFMNTLLAKVGSFLHILPTNSTNADNVTVNDTKHAISSNSLTGVQIEVLKSIDKELIYMICTSESDNLEKINLLLEAFGFTKDDFQLDLLVYAIYESLHISKFTLESLSSSIAADKEDLSSIEIQRFLATCIKRRFKFTKSVATEFIHLINILITTKGDILK